ncbi:tyrosine-type recombinase/integrase [Roseateles aquatilis]|nr:phage integrase N-terminal domain-containing protein [Roseateles aquatilis]MBY0366041.1 integrase domain-containing protein [Burkholderiaceae bacterium]
MALLDLETTAHVGTSTRGCAVPSTSHPVQRPPWLKRPLFWSCNMTVKQVPRAGTVPGPDGGGHARRHAAGSARDPDAILARLPMGTRDYVRVLGAILLKHNHEHSAKHKGVSFKTMRDRERFLVSFFRELRRTTQYRRVDPRQLANRHIEAMLERWLARKLATATIHNYLSFLRTFAGWIGKPGMVREPQHYVGSESQHAHRSQVATRDHSWSAHEVDIASKIAEIAALDSWVGLQVELCAAFGMRGKEARHFRLHGAVIAREAANPRDATAFPECNAFLRIVHGTKGGRPRDVPIRTDAQRELLERVAASVAPGMYVGRPGMTAQQSQSRFYYVIRKCGISKKQLGVVAHGLRHQHVNDAFEADAGAPSPVRGATSRAAGDEAARQRAARLLGHNRLQVTSCYLGSPSTTRCPAEAANDPT